MKFMGRYRKVAVIWAVAVTVVLSASSSSALAGAVKQRVAIVHLKGIKPYQSVNNAISRRLYNEAEVETFRADNRTSVRQIEQELKNFGPAVIVCIGSMAYQLCSTLDIAPVVLAYNTELLIEQNPFCILQYLRPSAKSIVAVVDENRSNLQCEPLITLAGRYNLNLSVRKIGSCSWKELLYGNDSILLERGVLIVNLSTKRRPSRNGYVVAVVDRDVEVYRQLEQCCISGLPAIDEIIDLSVSGEDVLREKLITANPAAVICIGANSYQHCKFMQDNCEVLVALKTQSIDSDVSRWGAVSGVSMFIEPKAQIEALSLLTKEPVTLAVPYDPKNSELLVLKALSEAQGDITFVALPVSAAARVSKVVAKALDDYDGIWVIPDRTISVAPIQKLLLEETLQERKMLVAMMHPYTKRGAAMAVSSTGEDDAGLCDRIVELINERLNCEECAGRIVPPPVSISLNIRTLKRLNYEVPQSLLERAEFIFGNDEL